MDRHPGRRNRGGPSAPTPTSVFDPWHARRAPLQGRPSVCRLTLAGPSTAEPTDAPQAAAQATTVPSAVNGPQPQSVDVVLPGAMGMPAPPSDPWPGEPTFPNRQNQRVHDASRCCRLDDLRMSHQRGRHDVTREPRHCAGLEEGLRLPPHSSAALTRARSLQRMFPGRADDGRRRPDVFNR